MTVTRLPTAEERAALVAEALAMPDVCDRRTCVAPTVHVLARELAAAAERERLLEAELAAMKDLLAAALPALGCHARDFSQRALLEACELLGSDPDDWSHHLDVLRRVRDSRAALAAAEAPQ